ncbi:MAG: hypothetical protein AAF587_04550 [Bacteroidota bacterium]
MGHLLGPDLLKIAVLSLNSEQVFFATTTCTELSSFVFSVNARILNRFKKLNVSDYQAVGVINCQQMIGRKNGGGQNNFQYRDSSAMLQYSPDP